MVDETRLTTSFLADHIRAAISALYSERLENTGVQGRAALNFVEERIAPFVDFRSSLFESFFETSDDEPGRSVLADTLVWLVDCGDIINAGNGRYFPSPTRMVTIPSGDVLILSGHATDELAVALGLSFSGGSISRIVEKGALTGLINTDFHDWSNSPERGAIEWAITEINRPLLEIRTDALNWQFADIEKNNFPWRPIDEAEDLDKPMLVQYRNEGTGKWVRLVGLLIRKANGIECVRGRTISYYDCCRIIAGLRMKQGIPRIISVSRNGSRLQAKLRTYELPEVVLTFTALCDHREERDSIIHFSFSDSHYARFQKLADFFGFELRQRFP